MRNHRLERGELFAENQITLDCKTTPEFEFNENAQNKCSYKAAQKPTNMMSVGFRVIVYSIFALYQDTENIQF